MNKKLTFCFLFCALFAAVLVDRPSVSAQTTASSTNIFIPKLQWKYGWRDGRLANTIGSVKAGSVLPLASVELPSGYSPAQISHAYGFDKIATNGDGRGKVIAIIDAYGSTNIQSDLNAFCAEYSLPTTTVSVVYPAGKPTKTDSGWAAETTLDVEWAHAMAPGASIVLVVAPDSGSGLNSAVTYVGSTLKPTTASMSWGGGEFSSESSYDTAANFNSPTVTFVASSGDSGEGVIWPASSPDVLAVGGTSLVYNANSGTITSEVAWSHSGGGESLYEGIPSYQLGFNVTSVTNTGSSTTNNLTKRGNPDVSYVADPYTGVAVYFTPPGSTGGWYVYGGTSISAPQWAALLARRASLGNAGTGPFNAVAYGSAKTEYATIFRDIVSGSNGYPAKTGYDLVTGLGSPVANQLALLPSATSSPTPSPTPSPTATPTPTPTPTPVGPTNVVSVWGFDGFGETNVPAGLSGVVQVGMGEVAGLALKSNGTIVPWGWNVYGQTNVPSGLTNATQIATGITHSVALKSDGTVSAWGENLLGQAKVPANLTNVIQVAAGGYNSAALMANGTVVAWGNNAEGQCNVPSDLTNAVHVAVGIYHMVALKKDGTVVAWGDNTFKEANVPVGLTNVVQVAAGYEYSLALKNNGTVVAWGYNMDGVTNVPTGLSGVTNIAAGAYHAAALKSDGTVVCWGDNVYGQCRVPANVTNAVQVTAGVYDTAVIKSR